MVDRSIKGFEWEPPPATPPGMAPNLPVGSRIPDHAPYAHGLPIRTFRRLKKTLYVPLVEEWKRANRGKLLPENPAYQRDWFDPLPADVADPGPGRTFSDPSKGGVAGTGQLGGPQYRE